MHNNNNQPPKDLAVVAQGLVVWILKGFLSWCFFPLNLMFSTNIFDIQFIHNFLSKCDTDGSTKS